jgi:beta-lactamase class A
MTLIKVRVQILATLIALTVAANSASEQTPAQPSSSLDTLVRAEVTPFKGNVYLFARNLDTGATYSFKGDERVRTASTIKIAVMIEAFTRVAEGRAKWTDELVLTKAARYGGSGVLPELADGLRLTLRDCVNLMMVVSDNTATNMVLDYLTTDAVNSRMSSLGFKDTRIMRRIGGGGETKEGKEPDNKRFGLGATTPHEMVQILEKIEAGEIVNKSAAKEMIDLMKREQSRYAIGRTIWDVPMASKYGALDSLRSCVAVVYSKRGRIAMAITVDDMPEVIWSVDNPGYLLMSRLSLILLEGLKSPQS